jgi:hypothetical protein
MERAVLAGFNLRLLGLQLASSLSFRLSESVVTVGELVGLRFGIPALTSAAVEDVASKGFKAAALQVTIGADCARRASS